MFFFLLKTDFSSLADLAASKAPVSSSRGNESFFKGATLDFEASSYDFFFIKNNSQLPVHHKVSHGAYKSKYKNPIHLKHTQTYMVMSLLLILNLTYMTAP